MPQESDAMTNSRRKGARIENEIVRMHADVCEAEKVSRTGYTGSDLLIAGKFPAEVKARKSGEGFVTLDKWLGENDLLFLRRDRSRPVVVMPWRMYVMLMRNYTGTEGLIAAEEMGPPDQPPE